MEKPTKDQVVELLNESREAALEFLLGWVVGLSAQGKLITEEDIDFIFFILNEEKPELENKFAN